MRKSVFVLSVVASLAGCATGGVKDEATLAVLNDADAAISTVARKCGGYSSPSYSKALQFASAGDLTAAQIEAAKAKIHADQAAAKCK